MISVDVISSGRYKCAGIALGHDEIPEILWRVDFPREATGHATNCNRGETWIFGSTIGTCRLGSIGPNDSISGHGLAIVDGIGSFHI